MATMPYSFFCSILLLIIGHTRTNAQSSSCDTTSCESPTVPIRFPFWINEADQSNRCGYPGFELKCNKKNQPLLTLPESGDYIVKTILHRDQQLWINVEPDECLPGRIMLNRGFSLAGSPFQLGNAFTFANYSFFSCPYDPTSSYMVESIDCLSSISNNINYSVLAMLSHPSYPTPWNSSCHLISSAMVPVPRFRHGPYWTRYNLDIQLQWDKPDCGACEQRGGRCGFLGDSTNQVACYNLPGQGLSRRARYGLTIGLGIPGLLVIIGLTCLLKRRMRMHNQRHQSRTEFSTMSMPHRPVVVMGLDGASIERYPKTQIGESGRLPKPNDTICSICLSEYQPKEMLRTIPECNHYFHADCIDGWLNMNAACPLCRNLPWRSSSSSSSLPLSPTSS